MIPYHFMPATKFCCAYNYLVADGHNHTCATVGLRNILIEYFNINILPQQNNFLWIQFILSYQFWPDQISFQQSFLSVVEIYLVSSNPQKISFLIKKINAVFILKYSNEI